MFDFPLHIWNALAERDERILVMTETLRNVRQMLLDGQGEEDIVLIIDAALAQEKKK